MKNIFVGNIPYSASEEDVEALFSSYGEVSKVYLPQDRETGNPRGFGFVEMPDDEEGNQAIEKLAGSDFMGRKLTVNEARPREPRRGGGQRRGHGGGRGGGRQRGGWEPERNYARGRDKIRDRNRGRSGGRR